MMTNTARKSLTTVLVFCAFAGSPVHLSAQSAYPWSNLLHLETGQKLEIKDTANKTVTGTLISVDNAILRVSIRGSQQNFERNEISRVVRLDSKMKRRVLIGCTVGAGAGLASGAIIASALTGGGTNASATTGGGAAGAVFGAAVGAALGAIPKRTVVFQK